MAHLDTGTLPHRGEALIKENYENTFAKQCRRSAQMGVLLLMGCALLYEEINKIDGPLGEIQVNRGHVGKFWSSDTGGNAQKCTQ
ncbi:hypothetical protein [Bradyrhizobium sp. ISRA464]|uniref:hypothetical protein n=2 Tax=unclassified Bradyrhizobium TaxID=2631580 RepID=UPI0024790426|nr:hypothetical protein [Bradyrhizobium sp. ISRA464]WGS26435.1 hypothetical protein MTX19_32850 [Bradyrhizobium sp. ISRA464]